MSQDGFESDFPEKSPEQSFPKIASEAAICRCSIQKRGTQKFPNIHWKTSVLESLF